MRLPTITTAALAALATASLLGSAACVDDVGGGRTSKPTGAKPDANCTKINNDVVIRTAADMASLPKTGCYDVYGKLTVQGAAVTSLAGLNGVNSVNELVLDHTSLASIDAKQPIGIYGGLTVTGNAKLTSLAQLEFETAATGVLIDGNPVLASLDPLTLDDPQLLEIDGDLAITSNAALAAVSLGHLTRVTGSTTIASNPAIATIDLSALTSTGQIAIASNAKLGQLMGLAATEVDGDFAVTGNPLLTSLGTMSSLYRVTGNLSIDDNAQLANLAAFTTSIKFIDQSLTISNNSALTDLGSLKHLQLVGEITITNNQNLATCRASEIDKCVAHPTASIISNNKNTNCSTQCN